MSKLLPKNFSTKTKKQLKIISAIFLLMVISLLFLITGPSAIELVESKVTSANIQPDKPFEPKTEVLGEINKPKVELISANLEQPTLTGVAVIAQDLQTDQLLYQKNINLRLSPASTTKIMTALIASENFNNADILTVPAQALVGGSSMGLEVGEKLTFRSLLYGMMLNSGNDAAFTIALNYPGGYDVFISKMNAKVKELGLIDTNFDNPAGFDSPTHYSSAFDLLQIAKQAIKNAKLGHVYSTKETSVTSIDRSKIHLLKNLNKLLGEDGVLGIKTGTTENAGESFVGLIEKNGQTILTVMLNSQDRFGETEKLLDWIFKNYTWQIN